MENTPFLSAVFCRAGLTNGGRFKYAAVQYYSLERVDFS